MPTPPAPITAAHLLFTLDPTVAHLNHGSFGAVPVPVQRAQQRLRDEVEADPMRFFAHGLSERVADARRELAAFVGAEPEATALVPNATAGVAVVMATMNLGAGDEVVLTDHGYNAVTLTVERESRRSGVLVRTVRLPLAATADEVVSAVTAAVTPGRTRLVVVDHVTSPTARVLPVAQLAAALRRLGVALLVDAAHTPGMLSVGVSEVGADFWVGNLHKWAYAPRGTALLAVAPHWRERVEPLVVSHEYPAGFPASCEWQGTLDYTAWLAAPVGVHTLHALGLEAVRAHNTRLAAYGQHVVGTALGLSPDDLPAVPQGLGMSVVPLPDGVATTVPAASELRLRIATRLDTQVAVSAWQGRGLLRLSAQVYNQPDEYDRLAERLPALLTGA